MKIVLVLLTLFISLPTIACEEFDHAMNELETKAAAYQTAADLKAQLFIGKIAPKEALIEWAQNSTVGGGRTEEIDFQGQKLLIVYRGYTSGVKSSDLGLYAEKDGFWTLVKSHPPIHNSWIVTRNEGDRLIFLREDNQERVLTLTAAELAL